MPINWFQLFFQIIINLPIKTYTSFKLSKKLKKIGKNISF